MRRAPILSKPLGDIGPGRMADRWLNLGWSRFLSQLLSRLRPIATKAGIRVNFPANCRFMAAQYHGYLRWCMSCFHPGGNLVSLILGQLVVSHCAALTLVGKRKLNNTSAYPLTNLLRVALTSWIHGFWATSFCDSDGEVRSKTHLPEYRSASKSEETFNNNVVDKSALTVDQDLDAVFTTVVGFADGCYTEKG